GRKTGSLGDAGCLSFYPSKNLGGYGDGGMVVTNDAQVAAQIRLLRTHGWRRKYYSDTIGYNSRLDELQAAILRVKLRHVDAWNDRRREIAEAYGRRLAEFGVVIPSEASYARHVYHLYVVRVKRRLELQERLRAMGIASAIYYPVPLHLVGAYAQLGHRQGDFPEAERAAQETLALPIYPEMSDEQLAYVAGVVESISVDRVGGGE
ncbi:MAG: DegT/DnrJ/EryC1/StrS family aminotransferase, partial [Chloroflexi bacterium]|nr:DegT/DnrJ/EryC1/StrS family aminotransferase [Chloroflexota bacterium]